VNEVEVENKELTNERTGSTYAGGVLFHCAQGKDRTGKYVATVSIYAYICIVYIYTCIYTYIYMHVFIW
jgi:hypothetical protein